MTEYTSLEVSKRLAEAGFDAAADGTWMMRCDARQQYRQPRLWEKHTLVGLERNDDGILAPTPYVSKGDRLGYAYRSDTLLAWLLEHGVGVYIDKKNGVDYVYPYGADAESVTAPTLPDALAEVVLKVLGVSK